MPKGFSISSTRTQVDQNSMIRTGDIIPQDPLAPTADCAEINTILIALAQDSSICCQTCQETCLLRLKLAAYPDQPSQNLPSSRSSYQSPKVLARSCAASVVPDLINTSAISLLLLNHRPNSDHYRWCTRVASTTTSLCLATSRCTT